MCSSGKSDVYTYDVNGNVETWLDRASNLTTYTYDALNNLTSVTAGGETTDYKTDPDGLFSVVGNAVSRDSVAFDAAGRATNHVTTRDAQIYQQDYTWDSSGRRESVAWAGQNASIGYTWDTTGQLNTLTDMDGGVTTLGYNDDRQLKNIDLPVPGGNNVGFQYPSTHRKATVRYGHAGLTDDFGMFMSQDNMARTTQRGWIGGLGVDTTRSFSYDSRGRIDMVQDYEVVVDTTLLGCAFDPDKGIPCLDLNQVLLNTIDYDFDDVGNRMGTGITVQTGNRLTSIAGYALTWDDAGFLQSKIGNGLTQLFVWNVQGQLESVDTDGVMSKFKYDGAGRRIETDIGGVVRKYWHDGDDLFVEFDANDNETATYTTYPGTDRLHSVKRADRLDSLYYYATDQKGTVLGLYTMSGPAPGAPATRNQYRYDPWGRPEGTTVDPVPNTLRYIGREFDDVSGLLYLRARYYDPEIGRFISEDPIGLAGGINPYVYAANDPINVTDRTGLDEDQKKACGAGVGPSVEAIEAAMAAVGICTGDGGGGSNVPGDFVGYWFTLQGPYQAGQIANYFSVYGFRQGIGEFIPSLSEAIPYGQCVELAITAYDLLNPNQAYALATKAKGLTKKLNRGVAIGVDIAAAATSYHALARSWYGVPFDKRLQAGAGWFLGTSGSIISYGGFGGLALGTGLEIGGAALMVNALANFDPSQICG